MDAEVEVKYPYVQLFVFCLVYKRESFPLARPVSQTQSDALLRYLPKAASQCFIHAAIFSVKIFG
jgi:hypothetical protein